MPSPSEINLVGESESGSSIAVLLIDVINALDFPEGKQLFEFALPMAAKIAELKVHARAHAIPVIYVNDNFGRWRSDFQAQVEHCIDPDSLGREIVERLRPDQDDYFVLKPKHSGFYSTSLDVLLEYLGVETLVLGGVAADICVLFTANDAYMRDYKLIVPQDCVAANSKELTEYAVKQMTTLLKADARPLRELVSSGALKKEPHRKSESSHS